MERLTESEWEQKRRDRLELIDHELLAIQLSEHDRLTMDVEHECLSWKDWWPMLERRKADGWVETQYGQTGSLFTRSGYFKRPKKEHMSKPCIHIANVTIAGNAYLVKYSYFPGCPASREKSGGLIDPGDEPQIELLEVTPIDTSNCDISNRELEARLIAELFKHHRKA